MMRDSTSRPSRSVPSRKSWPSSAGQTRCKSAVEQAPELVWVAAAEEADRLHVGRVVGVVALQRVHVEPHGAAVDERPDEAALVEEMHALRRRVDEVDVARVQIVGRQELADQDHAVEHGEEDAGRTAPACGA